MKIWFLPILILIATTLIAIPFSRYLAWIMDGKYHAQRILRWFGKAWIPVDRTGSNAPPPC